MSLVTNLVRSAIEAGAPTYIRDLREEHVDSKDLPLVQFTKGHLRAHGQLPTLHTLVQNGYKIGRVREPASYYVEEIKNNHIFKTVNDRFPHLVNAMRGKDTQTVLAVVREMALISGSSSSGSQYVSIVDEAGLVLEDYEYAKANPGLRGVTYGWPTLDDLTLGMMPGDLDVTVGRPGMGKSYLQQFNAYSAWRAGKGIAVVTMEMPTLQYSMRWTAMHSGINPRLSRRGTLSRWAEKTFRETIVDLQSGSHAPVHIMSGDFNKDVAGIETMVEQLDAEAVYIDAAYLLTSSGRKKGYSRLDELVEVIRDLKQMGLRLKRPVSATFQLNRNVKTKSTKDIDTSDIAGTDAIPQDASIVRGIRFGKSPFTKVRRVIDFIKNREGETKNFDVNFSHYPLGFTEAPPMDDEKIATDWML